MSKHKHLAKIDFILEMIEKIEFVVARHRGVVQALEDPEGQLALLMAVSQIGEALSKIDSTLIDTLGLQEERKGAYETRNFIVHDYDGVDLFLIERVIEERIPEIKEKLQTYRESIE